MQIRWSGKEAVKSGQSKPPTGWALTDQKDEGALLRASRVETTGASDEPYWVKKNGNTGTEERVTLEEPRRKRNHQ